MTKQVEAGLLYERTRPDQKKGYIGDCISVYAFQEGYMLNKDGSIAVGFEVTPLEEETQDGDGLTSLINEVSAACKRLPIGTVIQKIDIYHEEATQLSIPYDLPFFHRKTLEHHQHRKILKHRSLLFLRFFAKSMNPLHSFLALGNLVFKPTWDLLSKNKFRIESACHEFVSSMPAGLKLKRLDNQGLERLLYQYINLTFERDPICFENGLTALEDSLLSNAYLKSVRMQSQAPELFDWGKNNLGNQGVTSPFMWPFTHFASFPHITCQQIDLISDEEFRKAKRRELSFVAQLSWGARNRDLTEYVEESFIELDKELTERNSQIVKLSYQVLVWHVDKAILQQRVDQLKSAFGKLGIGAAEEKENTLAAFLANIPGGAGFLEGIPMPLDTAVAYFSWMTPRKGDEAGILLANRHGYPIYYDPFKYTLHNQHAFVFGPSGSGKSFFNGKMIKDRYYAGHTLMVIDSGGTYRFLFEALQGKYIEYDPAQPLGLNPFLIKKKQGKYKPDAIKISFLINFLGKMWKEDLQNHPITPVEYSLLSEFLSFYYASLGQEAIPTLTGFCQWLPSYIKQEAIKSGLFDLENFIISLKPFTHGMYQEHFNSLDLFQVTDSRLLCFELGLVKGDEKLYPLVVQVIFDYLLQLAAAQKEAKKFIDIEEGWKILDDFSLRYIEEFFRGSRKTNTSIRIITQSVKEIEDSKIVGAMQTNGATTILLYNDKESVRKDIAKFLGMSAFDQEKYASLRSKQDYLDGYREVFIKEMDQSAVWQVGLSIYEHALLTSQPEERNAITRIRQAIANPEEATIEWVAGILKKHQPAYGTSN